MLEYFGSLRSSSGRAASSRTASETPSRGSTTASSARPGIAAGAPLRVPRGDPDRVREHDEPRSASVPRAPGLIDRDEQMAILVQRVSGAVHGHLFYPQVAGVGLSYNPFAWSGEIDPEAGVLRLVFGLGTRAVDRSDDDYTRLVALNAPQRRPDAGRSGAAGFSSAGWTSSTCGRTGSRRRGSTTWRAPPPICRSTSTPSDGAHCCAARERLPVRPTKGGSSRSGNSCRRRRSSRTCGRCWGSPGRLRIPVDTEFTANFLPDGRCSSTSCSAGRCR